MCSPLLNTKVAHYFASTLHFLQCLFMQISECMRRSQCNLCIIPCNNNGGRPDLCNIRPSMCINFLFNDNKKSYGRQKGCELFICITMIILLFFIVFHFLMFITRPHYTMKVYLFSHP